VPTALAVWADWVKVADRWATDSGGGRRLPCAGAGRRGSQAATTRTVWQQSVPKQRKTSARSRWALAERRRGATRSVGQGHLCPRPLEVRPPSADRRKAGGAASHGPAGRTDRRRGRSAPKGAGDAVGGIAPAPKPAGAGNPVKSNEVQTAGPAGAGAASSGAG